MVLFIFKFSLVLVKSALPLLLLINIIISPTLEARVLFPKTPVSRVAVILTTKEPPPPATFLKKASPCSKFVKSRLVNYKLFCIAMFLTTQSFQGEKNKNLINFNLFVILHNNSNKHRKSFP